MNVSDNNTFNVVASLFDNFVKAVASEIQANKPSTDDLFLKDLRDSLVMTINGLENRLADMETRLQKTLPSDSELDDRIDARIDRIDPTDHSNFEYAVERIVDDKMENSSFLDEDGVQDIVSNYLRSATLSIEVN